jgi:diguanylate cyclase (GGDEF)-like protein/PAS domain S-box-containing protein
MRSNQAGPMVERSDAASGPAGASHRPELVELRRRLDDLTRLVSDWVWETDAQIRLTSVSERVVEVLGWPPRMIQGQSLGDFCVFSEPAVLEAKVAARLAFRNLPCQIPGADGAQRHFLVSGVPIFDPVTGAFSGYRGTARDITRRVLAEQTLGRRDAVLQAVGCAASALLNTTDWRGEMPRLLAVLGSASSADDVHVFELVAASDGKRRAVHRFGAPDSLESEDAGRHELAGAGGKPDAVGACRIEALISLLDEPAMATWQQRLDAGDVIMARASGSHGPQQGPPEPGAAASVLAVPVFAGAALWGFLRFDRLDRDGQPLAWQEPEIEAVKAAANIIGSAVHHHASEQAIRKLSEAIEQSPALVLMTDANGLIEYVNPRLAVVTGYAAQEILGQTPEILGFDQGEAPGLQQLWDEIKDGEPWRGEICSRSKDGREVWVNQTVFPIRVSGGDVSSVLFVGEDVTAHRRFEQQLTHQAHHDTLTDLPNRRLFFDHLTRALAEARRGGHPLALICIDLDQFHLINSSFGLEGGDAILRQVADRLSAWVNPCNILCRLAGDEFALLLGGAGARCDVAAVVPEILAGLSRPFRLGDDEIYVHASVGVALFPKDGDDEYSLLKHADMAMICAKGVGGNAYQFFTPDMDRATTTPGILTQHLRQALHREQFELFYQPVVQIASGRVIGAEALLRWRHPTFGLVPPVEFISLAERDGLIEAIGGWVLKEACRQNRAWRDDGLGPIRMSVNVSGLQLQRGRLHTVVSAALSEARLPPSSLCIEITESAVLADIEEAKATLDSLNEMGVAISVDDFGTGYASLTYLRRLPLSELKIDRTFICDLGSDRADDAIVDAIIAMAHRLDLTVVAEGVDRESQLAFLRSRRCELMQGYYFSPPVPAAEFRDILRGCHRRAVPPRLPAPLVAKG